MHGVAEAKNQVLVLPISTLVTGNSIEASEVNLNCIPYIHYSMKIFKDKKTIRALIDSGSKVNAIASAYTAKIGLNIHPIYVIIKKINGLLLMTFKMIIAGFQVIDKLSRARFFKKTFLLANINIEIILEMPFLPFAI